MNIKEAGQYANFLNDILGKAQTYSTRKEYMKKTTQTHLRSKVNPEVLDEIIEVVNTNKLDVTSDQLARLALDIIDEKMKLSMAIEKGKKKMNIDWKENDERLSLDIAVAYNKQLRTLIYQLSTLKNQKAFESKGFEYGYKFNAEGNQVAYKYEVETVEDVTFDKDVINNLYKELQNKTNTISMQIDTVMLKDVIEFSPSFDILESFEEIVESIKNK